MAGGPDIIKPVLWLLYEVLVSVCLDFYQVSLEKGDKFKQYSGKEYYYNEAFGIAKRFNDRNGTNKFTDGLNMSFLNAL